MTLCTIAVPVFNRKDLVTRCINSALAECRDHSGIEVLVIDNCSTDGTWDTILQLDHPALRRLRNERNVGLFGNFNRCLQEARGELIRFLCSDDCLRAGTLAAEINLLLDHPAVGLLSSPCRTVTTDGELLGYSANTIPPGIYRGASAIRRILREFAASGANPLNYPSGILLRTAVVRAAGGFDESFQAAGDIDLFLRVLERADLAIVAPPAADVTVHAGQLGKQLSPSGVEVSELGRIFRRYADHLGQEAGYQDVIPRYSALCFLNGWRHLLRGNAQARERCFHTSRQLGGGVCDAVRYAGSLLAALLRRRLRQRSNCA